LQNRNEKNRLILFYRNIVNKNLLQELNVNFIIKFFTKLTIYCFFCFIISLYAVEINTNGENGNIRTQSAKTLGKTKMNIGAGVNFEQSSNYVKGPLWNLNNIQSQDSTILGIIQDPAKIISSNVYLAMGLVNFWDISLALPIYYDWSGFGPYDAGLGDLNIATKFMMPPITFDKNFYQAIFLSANIPTGMKGKGLFPRHIHFPIEKDSFSLGDFYTIDYITVKPMLLLTFDIGPKFPLQIHINLGGEFTQENMQNTFITSLALEYSPKEFITLFSEIWTQTRWINISPEFNMRKDPIWLTPGIKITTPNGLYFSLSGDFSLSSKKDEDRYTWNKKGYYYSTAIQPDYGVHFTFGWNGFLTPQDRDKDGVKDNLDKCPDDPEDIDGFEDGDGCPDPDNDKDGICDLWVSEKKLESHFSNICKGKDECPNQAEDLDNFKDDDGCPEPDNDGDGILDAKDQCINQPEDFDGFQDNDGCPDYDNDKDGIPDSLDRCPNDPEDLDGFEDKDGCPDIDNDKDGILDLKDKCPNEAENYNGYQDEDGCPDTIPQPAKKEIDFPAQQVLRGVTFVGNTAELTFESFQWLDPIAKSLKEYKDLEIEIRCYSDSRGNYSSLMQLTQMRAEAIRQYLISHGADGMRIRAIGFGPSNPIADNRTAAGRALNRRVEIIRIK
jgi:outer membrane protein OmpA-like peptidoglycan-associated protein